MDKFLKRKLDSNKSESSENKQLSKMWIDFSWKKSKISPVVKPKKELASLSSDRGLRMNHAERPPDAFWISIMHEYPYIAKKAIKVVLQFSTSYLCELRFSILNNIENKKTWERLQNVE